MAGILDWVGETLFGDDSVDQGASASEVRCLTYSSSAWHFWSQIFVWANLVCISQDVAIVPQEEDVVYPDNMISKEHLYDMFSSFTAIVESEDGKRRLKDAVAEGKAVEDVTSQIQVRQMT